MKIEQLLNFYQDQASKNFNIFCNEYASPLSYASWLSHTYSYVSLTVPTLRALIERYPETEIQQFLKNKIKEELDHDLIILKDMSILGSELSDFQISPPIKQLVKITESISHIKDFGLSTLLGHMLVLEALHPTPKDIIGITLKFGIPIEATNAFRIHSELDADHSRSLKHLMRHHAISYEKTMLASIRVLQLFRDHWIWMMNTSNQCHLEL